MRRLFFRIWTICCFFLLTIRCLLLQLEFQKPGAGIKLKKEFGDWAIIVTLHFCSWRTDIIVRKKDLFSLVLFNRACKIKSILGDLPEKFKRKEIKHNVIFTQRKRSGSCWICSNSRFGSDRRYCGPHDPRTDYRQRIQQNQLQPFRRVTHVSHQKGSVERQDLFDSLNAVEWVPKTAVIQTGQGSLAGLISSKRRIAKWAESSKHRIGISKRPPHLWLEINP